MMMPRLRRLCAAISQKAFLAIALSAILLVSTGCSALAPPESPSAQFEQTQAETSGRKAPDAVAKEAVKGSSLNDFFPRSVAGYSGYDVVAAQEKKGFAQFKVNEGGENVAMLSINDTISNPNAATKYESSTRKIQGSPALDIGNNGTGVLVGDRFQVKVQSRSDRFSAEDREAWLQKFDFKGLAKLNS